MAERTTRRRKKKENTELEKPTKEETAVARHLRFNLPTKNTSIDGHKVEYFTGSKAVDFLLDSKWATGKGKTEIIFTGRESVANYLDGLLWKGLFYRALKVVKKSKKEGKEKEEIKKEKKAKKEKKKTEAEPAEKGDDKEKEKEEAKGDVAKETKDGGKEDSPPAKKKEGKKKIKLELTDDQKFVDGNDAFVWVYDPVRPMNYVYGLGLVIGAIAVCLFPLWPPWMRTGTYYLCLCGAGFVGAIFALAIIRLIIFVLTWGATFGKIHFWLFPNLLADVGIKESFIPFYEVDYVTKKEDDKTEKSKDDSNDEKGSETTETEDHPNQEPSQDSGPVENIPENIGDTEDRYLDQVGTPPENSDITEEKNVESGDENEENEEDEDDEEEEEDEDDDNGEDFEMIDEEEISEVCDGSGGSQKEEEE